MTCPTRTARTLTALACALVSGACASGTTPSGSTGPQAGESARLRAAAEAAAPRPDPRTDLSAGLFDAEQAVWNMRLVSSTPASTDFVGGINSDLAFAGDLVFQGSFSGFQVWDVSDPRRPTLAKAFHCPASQSDVSVYRHLLFVSGEDFGARLDCGTQGVRDRVSPERLRGIRIFDITAIQNPRYVANVQTCRGSHTHTLVEDPRDPANVYIYVSGSAPVRSTQELAGCVETQGQDDPANALFRIEVIRVPLANPERAAVVSSPRIFGGLVEAPTHGLAPDDRAEMDAALARFQAEGLFVVEIDGRLGQLSDELATFWLDSLVAARGGTGAPTAADTTKLRAEMHDMVARRVAAQAAARGGPLPGPTQCHDITVYSAVGLAGGACEGYGMLLDISDPVNPRRLTAVADPNFAYWHSATFNNDATQVLFTDEWGGGGSPKCRATDPREWGANALFDIENRDLVFRGYYKLPAVQSAVEVCVAHNGSLLPIPGRDVMVQAWYSGGISVFDWTDPTNPVEIAYHDRGPVGNEPRMAGPWSVYWYNGLIVSSEIARGLDILELTASPLLTQNELDAANTVRLDHLNAQSQPRYEWPATFALARAYIDQLERGGGLPTARISATREALRSTEAASGAARRDALTRLASELDGEARGSQDADKVRTLAATVRALAG
ncbi:MAG: hypothetical protein FJ207_05730 [Gemmatimonadetes bacterium]|nr:hypothetical protein [Gemmatimonadota bacterium]